MDKGEAVPENLKTSTDVETYLDNENEELRDNQSLIGDPSMDYKQTVERLQTLANEIRTSTEPVDRDEISHIELDNMKSLQRHLLKAQIALHSLDNEKIDRVASILGLSRSEFTSEIDNLSQEESKEEISPPNDDLCDMVAHLKKQKIHFIIYLIQFLVLLSMYWWLYLAYQHVIELKIRLLADKEKLLSSFTTYVPPKCPELEMLNLPEFKCDKPASKPGRMDLGTKCTFSCPVEYRLRGKEMSECVLVKFTANWTKPFPVCKHTPCSSVKDRDCNGLRELGQASLSGVYSIVQCKTFTRFKVYCDFDTDAGGWTAIQRRTGPDTNFVRTQTEFETFFGNPAESYWIGLNNINTLTKTAPQSLIVILTERVSNSKAFAFYEDFLVEGDESSYRLRVSGYSSSKSGALGNEAGDSLKASNGMQFTTFDEDRDWNVMQNCAKLTSAAWWHRNCTDANLNAEYGSKASYGEKSMFWKTWRKLASLKRVEMLIRPKIQ